jgi:hypothetical protein
MPTATSEDAFDAYSPRELAYLVMAFVMVHPFAGRYCVYEA